jgi:hypothetical protein
MTSKIYDAVGLACFGVHRHRGFFGRYRSCIPLGSKGSHCDQREDCQQLNSGACYQATADRLPVRGIHLAILVGIDPRHLTHFLPPHSQN